MEENIEFAADTIIAEPVEPQGPSRGEMRRVFSRIGLGLCLGLLVSQLVPSLLTVIFPTFDAQAHAFLVGGLCTGCFTLPVLLLLGRKLPAQQPARTPLRAGRFLALVCICYACMIVGNLVGIGVNLLLSPGSVDLVSDLASASGASLETVVAFVVLAPVFEELVFRKVLVDRVLPYGEWPAILFSGLTFGLFHGNLTQFFYAFLLGMILAFVYVRTGNILHTIGIHACINFLGGVLPILAPAATFLVMLVALAGVILFFLYRKQAHVERNAVPGVGAAMFGNVGMILFFVISGFLMVLVAYVLNHPELTVLG
ncbi:MAG: CPBP family intramembrane metalloprotease [Oscillospiraceae bacterium]|nr:CPBP family intramembrane metalloprotease [Oscillospiraceae bacterium]